MRYLENRMKLWSAIGFGLIGSATLWFVPAAQACTCGASPSFVRIIPDSPVIIRGKVLDHRSAGSNVAHEHPYSMTVEVKELLKGQTKSPQLTLTGGAGLLCRPEISRFPIDSEWVFALYPASWDGDKSSELAISSCGENTLAVRGDTVQGKVTQTANTAESVTLANLRKLVKKSPQRRAVSNTEPKGRCAADRFANIG
jgi:hypothetical protein